MPKVLTQQEINTMLDSDIELIKDKVELDNVIKMLTQAFVDGKKISYYDNGIGTISINIRNESNTNS